MTNACGLDLGIILVFLKVYHADRHHPWIKVIKQNYGWVEAEVEEKSLSIISILSLPTEG